jgi:hypothetical protein
MQREVVVVVVFFFNIIKMLYGVLTKKGGVSKIFRKNKTPYTFFPSN